MFIETDTQAPSKLRQERHVHGSRPDGGDLLGIPFHAAPAGAWFASHGSGYKHVAPSGAAGAQATSKLDPSPVAGVLRCVQWNKAM